MLIKTTHGPYLTVARDGIFVMLRQAVHGEALGIQIGQTLWNALGQPEPLQRVVGILASQGLSQTPDFAMVRVAGHEVQIVVRGEATVHVSNQLGGRQELCGQAASTWVETTLCGAYEFAVSMTRVVPRNVPSIDDSCLVASAVATADTLFTLGWEAPGFDEPEAVAPATAPTPVRERIPDPVATAPVVRTPLPAPASAPTVASASTVASAPRLPSAPAATLAPPSDFDEHTILSNNLVQYRAQMETSVVSAPPPLMTFPHLVLSTGAKVAVDRTILIGRAPQAQRVTGRELPRLIAVPSPNNDISRTHVQVRVEGDLVVVTDLNSTNGVILVEPGQTPRRLHPDEPTPVPLAGVVDLGDSVTFTVEAAK